jgi:RNA polymerase sigma factor (sigma-70 family)
MVRRAFRRAFDDDEVEDIYANAWLGTLRALEHRHERLSDEEVRRYVLAAVANHASKELRRRRRRPTAPLDAVQTVADSSMRPDERAAKLEDSRITRDLLASLPPRRRAVMLLRYGWGLTPPQVCSLVKGLSPRAYRKEITRGVDELTEKLRLLECGEWCADREPVLKAYAAGLASVEQQRQARQHLSHCRKCGEFVGRLGGHLHDLGSSLAAPTALDAIDDGRFSLPDRLGDVVHRVRESAAGAFGGRSGDGVNEVATQSAGLSTTTRGAGAAGTGLLAKLAGVGTAGKLTALCLGGGAAATACLAAGFVPAKLPGLEAGGGRMAAERPAGRPHDRVSRPTVVQRLGPPVKVDVSQPPTPDAGPPSTGQPPDPGPAPEPTPPSPATPPIAPSAAPTQQEFGVASAAPSTAGSSGAASSGGGASTTQREFGP